VAEGAHHTLCESFAVGFQFVQGGGLPCGLQVGFAGGDGAVLQALEDDGEGAVQSGDVGVTKQVLLFESLHLGEGQGSDLAGLLDQVAAAQAVANGCRYGLLDLSHDVLLVEGGTTNG
jgi:hypothetical protein